MDAVLPRGAETGSVHRDLLEDLLVGRSGERTVARAAAVDHQLRMARRRPAGRPPLPRSLSGRLMPAASGSRADARPSSWPSDASAGATMTSCDLVDLVAALRLRAGA